MSRKSDMVAALECREPETAVPIWELSFQAWDAFSGRKMILGKEFEAGTAAEQEKFLYSNAEIMISVAEDLHWAALTPPSYYWEEAPGQLSYFCLPDHAVRRQIALLVELAPPGLMIMAVSCGIITANYSDDFCEQLFTEPERIDELAENALAGSLEEAKRMRDIGVEALVSASDIADNSGLFFNPQQLERWIFPFMTRWSSALRELGLFSIIHSDGNLTACMDKIASSGINALQAIDTVAGMDIVGTKSQVAGRICLCGNVDCGLLLTGKPEDVFESTKNLLLACKGGGGWALGASNAVQREVPVLNYRAMIGAWKQYGAYSCSKGAETL